jgi:hypothetical protein
MQNDMAAARQSRVAGGLATGCAVPMGGLRTNRLHAPTRLILQSVDLCRVGGSLAGIDSGTSRCNSIWSSPSPNEAPTLERSSGNAAVEVLGFALLFVYATADC